MSLKRDELISAVFFFVPNVGKIGEDNLKSITMIIILFFSCFLRQVCAGGK